MNPVSPHTSRKRVLASLLLLALLASAAHGAPVSFTAVVSGELRTVSLTAYEVQGVPYLSLPELARQLGGGSRVLPARIQVDVAGNSALVGINDTRVVASQSQFSLRYPVVAHDRDVLIAVADAPPFFLQAFQIALHEPDLPAPIEALPFTAPAADSSPAPVAPEPVAIEEPLLGDISLPPPVSEPAAPPGEPVREGEALAPGAVSIAALDTSPAPQQAPVEPTAPGALDTVIIDPGHGGNDTGYVGPTGLVEKNLTLAIALSLRRVLKETTSARIFLTHEEDRDLTLKERASLAHQKPGALFVSVHAGASFSPRAHGFDIFFSPRAAARGEGEPATVARDYAAESLYVAKNVAQALVSASSAEPRGIHEVPLRLLGDVAMPGILIEIGFLTNPAEEALLQTEDYQTKLAEGIAAGLASAIKTGASAEGAQ